MAKKNQQSSGPSYSLLALLKRTLFLHETSKIEELVEEVYEYMLKDQSYEQIQTRYVEPMLRKNASFLAIEGKKDVWRLTEGNKINDAVYDVFVKSQTPLSERQILNRLAKAEHIAGNIKMKLDLKNDARFSDLEGGKFWILSEWVVVNEFARSILMKVKSGLTEKEILNRAVAEFGIKKNSAIFIPKLDERFVQKDKKWVLQRFIEQKTKLRPSQMDRLYQHLMKIDSEATANQLASAVFNVPANSTDIEDKLAQDPRFVCEEGYWDLRSRVKLRHVPDSEEMPAPELSDIPIHEAPVETSETTRFDELVKNFQMSKEAPAFDVDDAVRQGVESVSHEHEDASEQGTAQFADEEEPYESDRNATQAADEFEEGAPEIIDEYTETLRNKVVDFLQDAFHSEGIVYNVEIIDQFINSDNKEEFFQQFVLEHFVNPAKGRILTERELIKFMVCFAEPSLNDKIIDPCCGTGGFLLQILDTLDEHLQEADWEERDVAIEYELRTGQFYFVRINEEEREYFNFPLEDEVARWLPIIHFCKQQQLTGVDIDPFACRTADLNLAVQGFPEIVLRHDDSLNSKQLGSGIYDLVIGNPLAAEDTPTRFLRKSLVLAKPGGKILLLLPDDMFQDSRLVSSTLRNQIIEQSLVKAVIRFPGTQVGEHYGPKRTLLYCLRKHHETEQQSDVFVGEVTSLDALNEVIKVMEDPDEPVCMDDTPIAGNVATYILESYHGSAYNLLLESLRRGIVQGSVMSVKEWSRLPKTETSEE